MDTINEKIYEEISMEGFKITKRLLRKIKKHGINLLGFSKTEKYKLLIKIWYKRLVDDELEFNKKFLSFMRKKLSNNAFERLEKDFLHNRSKEQFEHNFQNYLENYLLN